MIRQNQFVDNRAAEGGGCYAWKAAPVVKENVFTGNLAEWNGGGLSAWKSSVHLTGNTFEGNHADSNGGAVFLHTCDSVDSAGNLFDGNVSHNGGGIYAYECTVDIHGDLFEGNIADSLGCGAYLGDVKGHLSHNTFRKNGGTLGALDGGGLYAQWTRKWEAAHPPEEVPFVIAENLFEGNEAGVGAAIDSEGGAPVIRNNTVRANRAHHYGGGLVVKQQSRAQVLWNRIEENRCFDYGWGSGGGIAVLHASPEIRGNVVMENRSAGYGGGIFVSNSTDVLLAENMVARNRTTGTYNNAQGGGICLLESSCVLVNNTVMSNASGTGGGGAYCGTSETEVMNSIFWMNEAPVGLEIQVGYYTGPSTLDIASSDVQGGQGSVAVDKGCTLNWGAGMLAADPVFAEGTGGDYHLSFDSPCRDAGDNGAVPPGRAVDFEQDPRIAGGTVDMGADEFFLHLYVAGDTAPEAKVHVRVVGQPGTAPVALWASQGLLPEPVPTAWGPWYLTLPVAGPYPLGAIPAPHGVLDLAVSIPPDPPGPYTLYLQALAGAALTNPWTLAVARE